MKYVHVRRQSAAVNICKQFATAVSGTLQRQNWHFSAAVMLLAAAIMLYVCGNFALVSGTRTP
jgi:hypothetical protein